MNVVNILELEVECALLLLALVLTLTLTLDLGFMWNLRPFSKVLVLRVNEVSLDLDRFRFNDLPLGRFLKSLFKDFEHFETFRELTVNFALLGSFFRPLLKFLVLKSFTLAGE